MITHIRMKNFKSWKDSGEVKLEPLTGFFGTNSSGKSSLLQMLLLLKQTIGTEEIVFFGDENSLVNLGYFHEVIHGHQEDEELELEFGCKFPESIEIRIHQRGLYPQVVRFDSFNFESTLKKYGNSQDISNICYDIGRGNQKIKLEGNEISYRGRRIFTGTYNNCYSIVETTQAFPDSNKPFDLLSSKFEELFLHVFYLGPTRIQPQRQYHWKGTHPKKIDQSGGGAIDAVLSAGIRKLKSSNREDATLIEDRISEWLQKMDLAHSFRIIPTESLDDQNYEVRIRKSPNSAEVTLADMGYGLADVLPMLIYCYYVEEGSTLILEQPGVHLHPMVQSELADFFIEVVNERNLQILVESHSEHLLTRLQLRIAEQIIRADQTALYFCENEDGESKIKSLELDELGNIKNWPKNFFGNVRGDLAKMTREQIKRQEETEG